MHIKLVQYQTSRKGFCFIYKNRTQLNTYTLNTLRIISDTSQVRMNRESKVAEPRTHVHYTNLLNTTQETLVHVIARYIQRH